MNNYAIITTPLENLLNKEAHFKWIDECQKEFYHFKEKLAHILIFKNWKQKFHVHVDASFVTLGTILEQIGQGDINQPIAFSGHKLFDIENNYTTIEREGLTMVYSLQILRHYLLGSHFKFFINHLGLCKLVNKLVLGGRIYH